MKLEENSSLGMIRESSKRCLEQISDVLDLQPISSKQTDWSPGKTPHFKVTDVECAERKVSLELKSLAFDPFLSNVDLKFGRTNTATRIGQSGATHRKEQAPFCEDGQNSACICVKTPRIDFGEEPESREAKIKNGLDEIMHPHRFFESNLEKIENSLNGSK